MSEVELTIEGELATVSDAVLEQGWSDGLPIVPPTRMRVEGTLQHCPSGYEGRLFEVAPLSIPTPLETIAANAVMAGCKPEFFPVVLAAIDAVTHPDFNLLGVQTTTHPVGPLLVVNGPIRNSIGLNCGAGAFGPGVRANATIGRALRLVLMNVGGARAGLLDKATLGHPGKYTYCIGELEEASPWPPMHVDLGFDATQSTVTAVPAEAPHNVNDHASTNAGGVLKTMAGSMAQTGANNNWHDADIVVVLSPEHARTIADDGLSKRDVQEYLFRHATTPMDRWPPEQQDLKFRKKWPEQYGAADASSTQIPIVQRPESIRVIVAGGPGRHSLHVPSAGIGLSITVPVA